PFLLREAQIVGVSDGKRGDEWLGRFRITTIEQRVGDAKRQIEIGGVGGGGPQPVLGRFPGAVRGVGGGGRRAEGGHIGWGGRQRQDVGRDGENLRRARRRRTQRPEQTDARDRGTAVCGDAFPRGGDRSRAAPFTQCVFATPLGD